MKDTDHKDFGPIVRDAKGKHYTADVRGNSGNIQIVFHTSNPEELNLIVTQASQLWKKKVDWLHEWLQACFDFYRKELKEQWYEGQEPLDLERFRALLGDPVSIGFQHQQGKLHYIMIGMNDDLVGDHCLEAHGTQLRPDELFLT